MLGTIITSAVVLALSLSAVILVLSLIAYSMCKAASVEALQKKRGAIRKSRTK